MSKNATELPKKPSTIIISTSCVGSLKIIFATPQHFRIVIHRYSATVLIETGRSTTPGVTASLEQLVGMGKKGKKAQAGKPKKLTPKDVGKRLNALAKTLEEELEGADLFKPLPPTDDCAICLVPLSRHVNTETYYQPCCGNVICWACYMEMKHP